MKNRALAAKAILIVENDQLLKLLTIDILEEAGFVVLDAADADEAVTVLAGRTDIAVLLTGINLSGSMDGVSLAHAVRARWPHIKIVAVSGRTHLSAVDFPAESRFLRKPYHSAAMISAIRTLIDTADARRDGNSQVYLDV
ncbi:MAG: response regulator [Pseudolabrys sp.]|nr:response regulator [Pseudolabrys sp.]MDP2298390.1 response regulator [Pseudolabrys sp.]